MSQRDGNNWEDDSDPFKEKSPPTKHKSGLQPGHQFSNARGSVVPLQLQSKSYHKPTGFGGIVGTDSRQQQQSQTTKVKDSVSSMIPYVILCSLSLSLSVSIP